MIVETEERRQEAYAHLQELIEIAREQKFQGGCDIRYELATIAIRLLGEDTNPIWHSLSESLRQGIKKK